MGRRRYQSPSVLRTAGKRPQWHIRPTVPVVTESGIEYREKPFYLGFCDELGKREAQRVARDILATINETKTIIPSQVPFRLVLDKFESLYLPTLKPNTRYNVLTFLSGHIRPEFERMRLCDITPEKVQGWINARPTLARSSRATLLCWMRSIWEYAETCGYASGRNPCERVRVGEGGGHERDLRALTGDELKRLIAAAVNPARDMIQVAAFCGLRIGEIRAMRWGDVQGRAIDVRRSLSQRDAIETCPKTRAGRRTVPLPFDLVRPAGATDSDRVFPAVPRTENFGLNHALESVGLHQYGIGWHTLRRTYATLMAQFGAQGLEASMGHASGKMTQRYIRPGFDEHARLAERVRERVQ